MPLSPPSPPQISEAANVVYENVDPEANIIFGALVDPAIEGLFHYPRP
ncbi:unnamed protein product [Discosporangium mesarthrocarpum]